MHRVLAYTLDRGLTAECNLDTVPACLEEKGAIVWLDFEAPTEADFAYLEKTFQFHPLALEDARAKFNLPKIESYDSYTFLIWQAVTTADYESEQVTAEVDIFVSLNYLVTIHEQKIAALDHVYDSLVKEQQPLKGSDWVLHRILDTLVDAYFPYVDAISNGVDTLQDHMFENPTRQQLRTLFKYKHQLLNLRKIVGPEREIAGSLARYPGLVTEHTQFYFADVHDHLIRIVDLVDTDRDVISGAMDIYLSQVSNRLNEVMKILTIVTVIFLPLTLITGIYGMNFRYMPGVTFRYGFFTVSFLMVAIAIFMAIYFKRRGWW